MVHVKSLTLVPGIEKGLCKHYFCYCHCYYSSLQTCLWKRQCHHPFRDKCYRGKQFTFMVGLYTSPWIPGFGTSVIQLNLILTQLSRPANTVPHQSCEVERQGRTCRLKMQRNKKFSIICSLCDKSQWLPKGRLNQLVVHRRHYLPLYRKLWDQCRELQLSPCDLWRMALLKSPENNSYETKLFSGPC